MPHSFQTMKCVGHLAEESQPFKAGEYSGVYHPSMSKVSLVELANLRFSDLSKTESSVLHSIETGQEAPGTSPSTIRAEVLEWLCTDTGAIERVHRHGLTLSGYCITGVLELNHGDIRFPIQLYECAFDTDIWLKSARLRSLSFRACSLRGMYADSAVIDTNLLLIDGCETRGGVSLRGAVIGGDIRTDGSTFNGGDGFALVCDRIRVSGGVFLSQTSSIGHYRGEVRFVGAE